MAVLNFDVHGRPVSLGWLVALVVLVICIVLMVVHGPTIDVGLIAALAAAYVIG